MSSFAPEVIADSGGKWAGNGLRFATEAEAQTWVRDLMNRWMLVTDTRVVPSDDPVNYAIINNALVEVKKT
jgi:hypothetical protein